MTRMTEVSARTLWEAYKMCDQGQIALSASCKKIRQKLMADLLNKIKILKRGTKANQGNSNPCRLHTDTYTPVGRARQTV